MNEKHKHVTYEGHSFNMIFRNSRTFHARTDPPNTISPVITHYEELPMAADAKASKRLPCVVAGCTLESGHPGECTRTRRTEVIGGQTPIIVEGKGRSDTVYSTAPLGTQGPEWSGIPKPTGDLPGWGQPINMATTVGTLGETGDTVTYRDPIGDPPKTKTYKESGEVEVNAQGGKQSKLAFWWNLPFAMVAVAGVMGYGHNKYDQPGTRPDQGNWHTIPVWSHVQHAITHLFMWMIGNRDEDHLGHAGARILMALDQRDSGRDPLCPPE